MDHLTFAELLGNYGEFVGAIAVVLTLLYLAVQISHSSRVGRATVQQSIFDSHADAFQMLIVNPELLELAQDFMEGKEIQSSDKGRLQNLIMYMLDSHQNYFVQNQLGLLDDNSLNANWPKLLAWVGNAPGQEWFDRNKHHFRDDFIAYVEDRLANDARSTGDVFDYIGAERH